MAQIEFRLQSAAIEASAAALTVEAVSAALQARGLPPATVVLAAVTVIAAEAAGASSEQQLAPFVDVSFAKKCPAVQSACELAWGNNGASAMEHGVPAGLLLGRCSGCGTGGCCGGSRRSLPPISAHKNGKSANNNQKARKPVSGLQRRVAPIAASCGVAKRRVAQALGKGGSKAAKGKRRVGKLPAFTPIERKLVVLLPRAPAMGVGARTVPKEYEGVVGIALNGVPIVHHHVDAVTGRQGDMTMQFDSCGGHGGHDHKYHLHLPPICLLKSLNGTVPGRSDWWLAPHPEAQWPARASAWGNRSPLVGWALDGFPIFGPYDPETGELQLSHDTGCSEMSELDECNGKTLAGGQYAYFITPTYPYVPKCLRGATIGTVLDHEPAKQRKCPAQGYNPFSAAAVRKCRTAPQYIFPEVIIETPRWTAATMAFGSLFVFVLICLSYLVPLRRLKILAEKDIATDPLLYQIKWTVYMVYACIFGICLCRSLYMFIDPYAMRGILPRVLEGLIFGMVYPLYNLLAICELYLFGHFRGKRYTVSLSIVGGQFIVQILMDCMRAFAVQPSWHIMCQIFYTVWGSIVLSAALYLGGRSAVQACGQGRMSWLVASSLSMINVAFSIMSLFTTWGGKDTVFGVQTFVSCNEVLVVSAFVWTLLDWMAQKHDHTDEVAARSRECSYHGDVESGPSAARKAREGSTIGMLPGTEMHGLDRITFEKIPPGAFARASSIESVSSVRDFRRVISSAGAKAYNVMLNSPSRSRRQSLNSPSRSRRQSAASAALEGSYNRILEDSAARVGPPLFDGAATPATPSTRHPAVPATRGYEALNAVVSEARIGCVSARGARSVAEVRADFEDAAAQWPPVTATLCSPRSGGQEVRL